MAALNLQNGESTLFWQDRWNGQPLESEMPELHSYAKNRKITAKQAMNTEDLTHLFHLPISDGSGRTHVSQNTRFSFGF
jgi:hypothetical protein